MDKTTNTIESIVRQIERLKWRGIPKQTFACLEAAKASMCKIDHVFHFGDTLSLILFWRKYVSKMYVNCLHYLLIWPTISDFELQEVGDYSRALMSLKRGLHNECKAIFDEILMVNFAPQ